MNRCNWGRGGGGEEKCLSHSMGGMSIMMIAEVVGRVTEVVGMDINRTKWNCF